MRLSAATQDRLAMHLWASIRGVKKRIEERWETIKDDHAVEPYREAVRNALIGMSPEKR
jgi:hypothetical protein